jgi:hypothetical protein
MRTARYILIAAGGICTFGSAALASAPASQGFRIQVQIPEYCEISASPILVSEENGLAVGSVFESCNIQEGFQVLASYRELLTTEAVAFTYAGHRTTLNKAGASQVANRVGAKFGNRPIAVQYQGLSSPLAINLTITYF